MLQKLINRDGLNKTLLAVALMGTLSIAGCSADYATMPDPAAKADFTVNSPGINKQYDRIPTPADFQVLDLSATGAVLCWTDPGNGLKAQIRVDGVLVAECDADDCLYLDSFPKAFGEHHWSITYTRGGQTGLEAIVYLVLPGATENDDQDRSDRRMERDN